jgi:hypothetical protein
VLAPKQVMIADGHHRYETMINLRDELRPAGRPAAQSLADWGTMFFAAPRIPACWCCPPTAWSRGCPAGRLASLHERVRPWFTVTEGTRDHRPCHRAPPGPRGRRPRVTFALREAGKPATLWLGLKPDADLSALGPPALQGLDVTVLHGLLAGAAAGHRRRGHGQAVLPLVHARHGRGAGRVASGEVQGGFLMNATKVDQVLRPARPASCCRRSRPTSSPSWPPAW